MPGETQAKPLTKSNRQIHAHKLKPSHSERAIGRATAAHISSIAKQNKKVNLRRELVLLYATPDLRFHGEIDIEPREDAIRTAIVTRNSEPADESLQLVFFVGGSRFPNIKDKRKREAPESGKAAGDAVVYQTRDQEWEQRTFCLLNGLKSKRTEVAAIAEGLAIVLSQILLLCNGQRKGKAKVVIFADCQAAMLHVDRFQRTSPGEGCLHSDPLVRKLVTRSQYLRSLGV